MRHTSLDTTLVRQGVRWVDQARIASSWTASQLLTQSTAGAVSTRKDYAQTGNNRQQTTWPVHCKPQVQHRDRRRPSPECHQTVACQLESRRTAQDAMLPKTGAMVSYMSGASFLSGVASVLPRSTQGLTGDIAGSRPTRLCSSYACRPYYRDGNIGFVVIIARVELR